MHETILSCCHYNKKFACSLFGRHAKPKIKTSQRLVGYSLSKHQGPTAFQNTQPKPTSMAFLQTSAGQSICPPGLLFDHLHCPGRVEAQRTCRPDRSWIPSEHSWKHLYTQASSHQQLEKCCG